MPPAPSSRTILKSLSTISPGSRCAPGPIAGAAAMAANSSASELASAALIGVTEAGMGGARGSVSGVGSPSGRRYTRSAQAVGGQHEAVEVLLGGQQRQAAGGGRRGPAGRRGELCAQAVAGIGIDVVPVVGQQRVRLQPVEVGADLRLGRQ